MSATDELTTTLAALTEIEELGWSAEVSIRTHMLLGRRCMATGYPYYGDDSITRYGRTLDAAVLAVRDAIRTETETAVAE